MNFWERDLLKNMPHQVWHNILFFMRGVRSFSTGQEFVSEEITRCLLETIKDQMMEEKFEYSLLSDLELLPSPA